MVGLHYFYLKGLVGERWLISGFYGPLFLKIDHTDNNNSGDKGETSLSHKSMQQGTSFIGTAGGHLGNATGYCNRPDLEMCIAKFVEELSKFKGQISKDHIVQVFSRKMDEVWNLTNTMEAGTSTQGEEQVKVQKGEQSSHHSNCIDATYDPNPEKDTLEGLVLSSVTCKRDRPLVETGDRLDQQNVQVPCNFNANPTEQTKKLDCFPGCNHNIIGMDATQSYCARTVPLSTDQVCEPNANVQENLSPDFTANSTGKYHGNSDVGDVTWPFTDIGDIDWDSILGWEGWVKEM